MKKNYLIVFWLQNYKRVAAVWMDDYIEALYKRNPRLKNVDPGDISSEIAVIKMNIILNNLKLS